MKKYFKNLALMIFVSYTVVSVSSAVILLLGHWQILFLCLLGGGVAAAMRGS